MKIEKELLTDYFFQFDLKASSTIMKRLNQREWFMQNKLCRENNSNVKKKICK